MNPCAIKQNGFVRSGEDMRSSVFLPDHHLHRRETVVCPKPRRVGLLNGTVNDPSRALRRHSSHQADLADSKAGSELLDLILNKGEVFGTNHNSTQVRSPSPPFFCGSPPGRVSNPLIQDALFREEKLPPTFTAGYPLPSSPALPPPAMSVSPLSPTSAAARKGGCVRASFGNNPAMRVEGFDCLDRDRSRNCRILALA